MDITPRDLKARLDSNDRPLLLDVRQDWETKLCRLDNAIHIPIEEIELRTDELNPNDEIVVYCHQGVRSAAVAQCLREQHGFKNVKNLAGGLDARARNVDRTMRRYCPRCDPWSCERTDRWPSRPLPSSGAATSSGVLSTDRRSTCSSLVSSRRCAPPSRRWRATHRF